MIPDVYAYWDQHEGRWGIWCYSCSQEISWHDTEEQARSFALDHEDDHDYEEIDIYN